MAATLLVFTGLARYSDAPASKTFLTVALHCLRRERDDGQPAEGGIVAYRGYGLIAVHLGHHDVHEQIGDLASSRKANRLAAVER